MTKREVIRIMMDPYKYHNAAKCDAPSCDECNASIDNSSVGGVDGNAEVKEED